MKNGSTSSLATRFLEGGGELGALIRGYDWTRTPIGPLQAWPQSLKTAVRIMLTSRQPIWIGWGRELTYLYNDPYKAIIGGKHPWALGRPFAEVWREIYNVVGPMADSVVRDDVGTYVEAQLLIMERHGYPEETYYTFSYSPIPDHSGRPGGLICANTDDTRRVIDARQLALLGELAAHTPDARDWREACVLAAHSLATNGRDLPFALIYLVDPSRQVLSLAGHAGISAEHVAAPSSIGIDSEHPWRVGDVVRNGTIRFAKLDETFGELPSGAWSRPPSHAALVPIVVSGRTGRTGVLIAGLNPFRQFGESYRTFVEMIARQIATSIENAQAYEEERRRAETLRAADQRKDEFLATLSHELRNPLAPLRNAIHVLRGHGTKDAKTASLHDMIERQVDHLVRLVDDLMEISRVTRGTFDLKRERVDIAAILRNVVESSDAALKGEGGRIDANITSEPLPHDGDAVRLTQIFANLLNNAIRYCNSPCEVEVDVSREGDRAVVRVRDKGVGIAPEMLPRIFDMFSRGDEARRLKQEGLGVGLALARRLAEMHGGTIEAHSDGVGKGSEFVVRLPLAQGAMLSPEPVPERKSAEALPGLRVLVVDDNRDAADSLRIVLELLGAKVDVAHDGTGALAAFDERRPDIVFLDLGMPGMDGYQVARSLRQRPDGEKVSIVALSGWGQEEDRKRSRAAGFDHHLVKPADIDALRSVIASRCAPVR